MIGIICQAMPNEVLFPMTWVDSLRFERSLGRSEDPHRTIEDVLFRFPHDCKIMVDAGIRLLCLANQLQDAGKIVTLVFDDGVSGTQGYPDRMGFFKFHRISWQRPESFTRVLRCQCFASIVSPQLLRPHALGVTHEENSSTAAAPPYHHRRLPR